MTEADRPRIVRVVPDVPAIHRRFDYSVPAALADVVAVGSRVRVPLHGRRVGGLGGRGRRHARPRRRTRSTWPPRAGSGPPPSVVGPGRVGGLAVGRTASRRSWARPRRPRVVPRPRPRAGTGPGRWPRPAAGRWPWWTRPWPAGGPSVVRLAPALDVDPARPGGRPPDRSRRRAGGGRRAASGPSTWPAGSAPPGCRSPCCPTSGPRPGRGGCVTVGTRAAAWAPVAAPVGRRGARRPRRGLPGGAGAHLVGRRRGACERGRRDGAPWSWSRPARRWC